MNLFKKKYKRSDWYEGLLWAEAMPHRYSRITEHLFVVDSNGMEGYEILWRNHCHEKPWLIKEVGREFGEGILSYLSFCENILNNY